MTGEVVRIPRGFSPCEGRPACLQGSARALRPPLKKGCNCQGKFPVLSAVRCVVCTADRTMPPLRPPTQAQLSSPQAGAR